MCFLLRYTPQAIDLEHKLKPFNPDFIPAVGDIDAFLKVRHFCSAFHVALSLFSDLVKTVILKSALYQTKVVLLRLFYLKNMYPTRFPASLLFSFPGGREREREREREDGKAAKGRTGPWDQG